MIFLLIILLIYIYSILLNTDEREFSILEVLPHKIEDSKILINKMTLLLNNFKSGPDNKGDLNITLDITNNSDDLKVFRIIVPKDYQKDISDTIRSNFPDF